MNKFKFLSGEKPKMGVVAMTALMTEMIYDIYHQRREIREEENRRRSVSGGESMGYQSREIVFHTNLRNSELINEMLNDTPNET
jgi:hypothetical protein